MYEKDYIMRVVEAYGSVLKVDPEELKGYTGDQWEMFCMERTPQEIEMLAELQKLESEILLESGKPEGVFRNMMKALELLKIVDENSNTYSQIRIDNIALLEKKLSGSDQGTGSVQD